MTPTEANRLRERVLSRYEAFQDRFGFGPCGAVAQVLRERGVGPIAMVWCAEPGTDPDDIYTGFTHYVNLGRKGKIIDASNPFTGCAYKIEEALEPEEWPDLVDEEAVQFWRECLLREERRQRHEEGNRNRPRQYQAPERRRPRIPRGAGRAHPHLVRGQ